MITIRRYSALDTDDLPVHPPIQPHSTAHSENEVVDTKQRSQYLKKEKAPTGKFPIGALLIRYYLNVIRLLSNICPFDQSFPSIL
ncbi:hypothetical protein J2Z65_002382 [Paenibacillus aceris]|uniref:Uncharacterized protein n=1 Tax=Paenibacillus aceris TaxID=869555 RepID=A0ABS4HWX8_9BACL|nr:hypothetical protein [Paenibacillus aceris]